jgi:hypothetical protein
MATRNALRLGANTEAVQHLTRALALLQHHFLASFYGQDLGVLSYIYLAWVLWHLGAPDQAQQRMREGLALAHQLNHPYSLAAAHAFAAWLHHLLRDVSALQG